MKFLSLPERLQEIKYRADDSKQLVEAIEHALDALWELHFHHCSACEDNMKERDKALNQINKIMGVEK